MIENIYKDYGYDDVISDVPYMENSLKLYPIKVNEWKHFLNYTQYLMFSKKHYGIDKKTSFLQTIVSNFVLFYNDNIFPEGEELKLKLINKVLKEICGLFTIVCRESIIFDFSKELGYCFLNSNRELLISDKNFNHVRKIILQQNLLKEKKIYEDKLVQEWDEKASRAKARKNPQLDICEIKNIVRCELSISYEEINKLNIFQLYMDFYRICNNRSVLSTDILRSTYGINLDKLPNISYTDSVLLTLLKDPSEGNWKEQKDSNVYKAMN